MIQPTRIKPLNDRGPSNGRFVLYWMQASVRVKFNHALEFAIRAANEMSLPVVVFFGVTDGFPEANLRHYQFMIEGLVEVQQLLRDRGILMVVRVGSPEWGAIELARGAALVVTDRGYLRIQREWRRKVGETVTCPFIQVESEVVVPIETASGKEEYAAATLRPKIKRLLDQYLAPLQETAPRSSSLEMDITSVVVKAEPLLASLRIDRSVPAAPGMKGGEVQGERVLNHFLDHGLVNYAAKRNDPAEQALSGLSPYLHFGQISPLYIARRVMELDEGDSEAFLEELIVRRELSVNFVYYNDLYDQFGCLPEWARKTLASHESDPRQFLYSLDRLEQHRTHDPYWNAAQAEMVHQGKMHGYMRMYWGKKVIEWSGSPAEAFRTALYLNNKYELDGRDPNGFAGVAWCFGKHDRPWAERAIFGMVRYMNDQGLRRKFDIDRYVDRIKLETGAQCRPGDSPLA